MAPGSAGGGAAGLAASFAALAARLPLSAVDISDREITFALAGPAVLDLLATGCPRDLAKLAVGSGARTLFDTVQVVLTREAADRFHLTVWRSFALTSAPCSTSRPASSPRVFEAYGRWPPGQAAEAL